MSGENGRRGSRLGGTGGNLVVGREALTLISSMGGRHGSHLRIRLLKIFLVCAVVPPGKPFCQPPARWLTPNLTPSYQQPYSVRCQGISFQTSCSELNRGCISAMNWRSADDVQTTFRCYARHYHLPARSFISHDLPETFLTFPHLLLPSKNLRQVIGL